MAPDDPLYPVTFGDPVSPTTVLIPSDWAVLDDMCDRIRDLRARGKTRKAEKWQRRLDAILAVVVPKRVC